MSSQIPDYQGVDRWQNYAACRGLKPSMFVLDIGVSSAPARAVCATCTVTDQCDTYALVTNSVGVWGGKIHQNNRSGEATNAEQRLKTGTIKDMRPRHVAAPAPRKRRRSA